MAKVALIEKNKTNTNFNQYFDFDYDSFALCEEKVKKATKKDITLEFDADEYDYVILVGADPAKHVGKITSVIKYQGYLVDEKYLPITNPAMLAFKPEGKNAFMKAVSDINDYVLGNAAEAEKVTAVAIEDEAEALKYVNKILSAKPKVITLDSETTALYPRDGYVLGISISYKDDEGVYISSDAIDEDVQEALQKLFDSTVVVFHNAKFDMAMLEYHFGFKFTKYEDTMLLHYCMDEQPGTHDLKTLTIKYTDLGDYEKKLTEFKRTYTRQHGIKLEYFTYDLIPFDVLSEYAAKDTIATFRLFNLFYDTVQRSGNLKRLYKDLLKPGTIFLKKIQENGVPFDRERLANAAKTLGEEIEELTAELYTYAEVHMLEKQQGKIFNPNSVPQLRVLFFDILKLPIPEKRTGTGAISTDAEVLEELAQLHKVPEVIWKLRKLKKIKSTYIDKIIPALDADSRLRTNFNLTTTTSGRLSSSGKLNMQQLPRDNKVVKSCIKARPGWKIVSIDLQTAEMYIVAALSGDKNLQQIFIEGGDYHSQIAKAKFNRKETWQYIKENMPELRQQAKTVSFEILYKLNLREPVLERFPTLKKWLKKQAQFIQDNGYTYSFFGRKRRLPNVFSKDRGVAQHEVRSGVNALVQGPASDVNLLAGIEMQEYIEAQGMKSLIFGLVHDSILAEVPDEELEHYKEKLVEFIQKDRGLSIRMDCPIGVDIEVGEDYSFATPV